MKRSVAESVPDRVSVHTRNAAFEAVSAPEQYCSAPLLKVERSVSDRFLKRSESSLNTFIRAEIATEPRFGTLSFQINSERCKLHKRIELLFTLGTLLEQFLHHNRTLIPVHTVPEQLLKRSKYLSGTV